MGWKIILIIINITHLSFKIPDLPLIQLMVKSLTKKLTKLSCLPNRSTVSDRNNSPAGPLTGRGKNRKLCGNLRTYYAKEITNYVDILEQITRKNLSITWKK